MRKCGIICLFVGIIIISWLLSTKFIPVLLTSIHEKPLRIVHNIKTNTYYFLKEQKKEKVFLIGCDVDGWMEWEEVQDRGEVGLLSVFAPEDSGYTTCELLAQFRESGSFLEGASN